ncbi:hypothetical protein PMAYCL1PPCAC_19180, partial [Pristionchus mayeri]
ALIEFKVSLSNSLAVTGPKFSEECVNKCFSELPKAFRLLEKKTYVWNSFEGTVAYPFYINYTSNFDPKDYGTITQILRTHKNVHNISSMEVYMSTDGTVLETPSAPEENTQGEAYVHQFPANKNYQEAACVWQCINGEDDKKGILAQETRIYNSKVGDDYTRLTARIDEGGDYVTVLASAKYGLSLGYLSDQDPPKIRHWHFIGGYW